MCLIFPGRRAPSKVAWLTPYTIPYFYPGRHQIKTQNPDWYSSLHLLSTWISALHNSCCKRSIWRAVHGKQKFKTGGLSFLEAAAATLRSRAAAWSRNFRWLKSAAAAAPQEAGTNVKVTKADGNTGGRMLQLHQLFSWSGKQENAAPSAADIVTNINYGCSSIGWSGKEESNVWLSLDCSTKHGERRNCHPILP